MLGSVFVAVALFAADVQPPTTFAGAPYFRTFGVADGLLVGS